MNLAASQNAPLVVVLENNQWAYSTPVSRQVPIRDLANRALAYGIRGPIADGNDVLAVYKAAKEAVDDCRAGRGPVLLEVKTMRMKGHAQHDPAEYVPQAMFDYWKARDPIALFEKYLTENYIWDAEKKAAIDARIEQELDSEQKFAEESPLPPPELAEQGVYCEGCHTIEAKWHRPQAEVMPPASSVEAVWTVSDFGALRPAASVPKPAISVASHLKPPAHPPKHGAKHAPKPPEKAHGKPPAPFAPEPDLGTAPALRVPFGRGPKDRAFRQEQQNAKDARRNDKKGRRR
jgi:hypothetical protein